MIKSTESFKSQILSDSWWPVSKRIFLNENLGEQSALLFAFLVDKHDNLVESRLITQGDWFFFLKEEIQESFRKSFTWQDAALRKLVSAGLVETRLGQGKKRMYRIDIKKFKTLL